MAKALPVMGIVGAVFAALCFAVLAAPATFLIVPVMLAGSVVLVGQRTVAGTVAGLLVLALHVVAVLGLAGSVTTEDGATDFGIGPEAGLVLAIAACLSLPVAAIALRWDDAQPRWLAVLGLAAAAAAVLVAANDRAVLDDHFRIGTVVGAALSLAAIAPLVVLLRSADDDALTRELVAADAPVRAHASPGAAPPSKAPQPAQPPQPPHRP